MMFSLKPLRNLRNLRIMSFFKYLGGVEGASDQRGGEDRFEPHLFPFHPQLFKLIRGDVPDYRVMSS
jgi:hypothetical protein